MINRIFNTLSIPDKIKVDSVWNILSYLIIGAAGLSMPLLVAKYYNPKVLGILNISLIILTICSQISGFGIHFSVLKYVAENSKNFKSVKTIMVSSLLLISVLSILFSVIFFLILKPLNTLFPEKNMFYALLCITPAFYFLSVNKLILGYYNAMRKMKVFAVINSIRYLNWILLIIIFINYGISQEYLPIIFFISEAGVFLLNIPLIISVFREFYSNELNFWIKEHFIFGFKAMHGALFVDFNSRVDVLLLNFITNSYTAGIYTLASMVVDGFLQLTIVFRIIVNPLLTKYYYAEKRQDFLLYLKKGKKIFYLLGIPLIIICMTVIPFVSDLFELKSDYKNAYIPLLLSLTGLLISFGYQPFQMIFIQTGFPLIQTYFWGVILLLNLITSSVLIYLFGIVGAGFASFFIFLLTPIIINIFSKRYLKFSF